MDFEKTVHEDLCRYLRGTGRLDEREPECPDLERLWPSVAEAYLPDGIREFGSYPLTSLGWMMFVGMAFAKYWDMDWDAYSRHDGATLYRELRDAGGYDNLDDHVMLDVLGLDDEESRLTAEMVGECAARVCHALQTSRLEPGTAQAAQAYVAALRQLYLMGIYTELGALGYRMTKMG